MDGKSKNADMVYPKGELIGQYKIIETLKQGQFADTYLGRSIHDKTLAVIKVIRPPLTSELQKDFLVQVRMLMNMEHPHILQLRDAGVENHYPFLIADYVPHLPRQLHIPHQRGYKARQNQPAINTHWQLLSMSCLLEKCRLRNPIWRLLISI